MTKPAFCATCVEERSDLQPREHKGRVVWLCPDCDNPLGILRQHEIQDRDEGGALPARRRSKGGAA